MPALTKRSSKLRLEFVANTSHSVHGGLPAVEALCQQFGLWEKLRLIPGLDPRKRKTHGYSPELMVAQLLYSLCSGGASLADAERFNEEPLAKLLARVPAFADQTTVGEWLRAQSPQTVAAFWELIRQFVNWVLARADARRWTYCGRAEVFFDDTQLEVSGPSFQGARVNYNGDLALSWQTFWFGPFLTDSHLDSPGEVSAALPAMLERTAAAQPEAVWGTPQAAVWRDGLPITEQHCLIRYQPQGAEQPQTFAVVRFKRDDEMFWNYRFVVCEGARSDAAAVFARHKLKGEKEQLFKEVLNGLDLHHPPCAELNANRMFYAVAALAYNLMAALKLLHLPDACQGW
jgi:hypothetical protein